MDETMRTVLGDARAAVDHLEAALSSVEVNARRKAKGEFCYAVEELVALLIGSPSDASEVAMGPRDDDPSPQSGGSRGSRRLPDEGHVDALGGLAHAGGNDPHTVAAYKSPNTGSPQEPIRAAEASWLTPTRVAQGPFLDEDG